MTNAQETLDMAVFIPLVVAHQFYRLFRASQAKTLVLLAADALNKTKPLETLAARVATRKPSEPDSLFLLNNMNCLRPIPADAWPKRLKNKAKWGDFAAVMAGLELYLSCGGEFRQAELATENLKALTAMMAFATFDIEGELAAELVKPLFAEQDRLAKVVLGDK